MIKSTKWIEQYWHIDNNGGKAATLWCMWASFVHSSSLGPTHSHLSVVIRAAPLIMSAGWHSTFPSSVFSFQFHLWYWIELLGCCWLQARRQMNTQLSEPLSSKREFLLSLHFVFVQINRLIYIPFPAQFQFQKNAWQLPADLANLRQMIILISCEPDLVIFETDRDADPGGWHRVHMVTPCHNVPNQRHSLPPQLSQCPSHPS